MIENGDSPPAGAGLVPSTTLKRMVAAGRSKRRGRRVGRGRKRR